MKKYEKPLMEIVLFQSEIIMTGSDELELTAYPGISGGTGPWPV